MTTVIIIALSVAVIAEAVFIFKYKFICKTLTAWMMEKGFPLPSNDEIQRMANRISESIFKK